MRGAFLSRVGRSGQPGRAGQAPGRTLADHLHPLPAPTRGFLHAVSTASGPVSARRTLADHVHPAAPPPAARPAPTPPAAPTPPPAPLAQVGQARESEKRTVLDAAHPVTTLTPEQLPRSGSLHVELTWQPQRSPAGVSASTDLHLGCLWQTADGDHAGVVTSLGGLRSAPGFGARQVLRLGERSEVDGESLTVDLATLDSMRRLLVFAAGRRSRPSWAALAPRLAITLPSRATVVLRLDAPAGPAASVALLSVHLVAGDVVLRREDDPFDGPPRDVALAYGWELDWDATGATLRR